MPKSLERACAELGLEIIAPFDLKLDDGTTVRFDVLLPQLGGKRGMLIAVGASLALDIFIDMGFGFTSYNVYDDEDDYVIEDFQEMFSDWGWASQESEKPDWMV